MPGDIFDQIHAEARNAPPAPVVAAGGGDIFDQIRAETSGAQQRPAATIGPGTTPQHAPQMITVGEKQIPYTPPTSLLEEGMGKLKQWASMTPEGQQQHPFQAEVGKYADRIKQMLVGGQGGGLNMKTGFLTNPVTSMLAAGPGDAIDTAADIVTSGWGSLEKLAGAGARSVAGSEAKRAITQTIAPETASAKLSATRAAGTTGGAATSSVTNEDVLRHAGEIGVNLTPAQELGTEAARSEQVQGEQAFTGSKLKNAIIKEKENFNNSVDEFQDRLDPKRAGMSPEATGEHLQNSAESAKTAMKNKVNAAYDQVREQGADLAGDIQKPMNEFLYGLQNQVHPTLGMSRPVTQTAGAKAAIKDIEGLLSDPGLQGPASIDSLRNLRTTLLEKGNDYGANALSDSGQRVYKLAAGKVDDAIMEAAKGTPFQETFREAGRQNKILQETYNERSSPLYRILNTDDPAKVSNGLLSHKSVHEIEALKNENFDLGPVARQAVEDIKNGGYRITKQGLGGYSDTFLRSLLGPDQAKELYMKADIARRLTENYNPSGSGKVLIGAAKAVHPLLGNVLAEGARARSMPRPMTKYLGTVGGAMK